VIGPYDALLLDFGGVCLLTPFELYPAVEIATGLAPGSMSWMGPFDESTDELWRELFGSNHGVLNEREYWHQRSTLFGEMIDRPLDTHGFMQLVYEPSRPDLVRSEANDVVERARDAGLGISVLTNDLTAFHGPAWKSGIPLLSRIDHLVDCSETGILKPDQRAYKRAADVVGFDPSRVLFVDDHKLNVQGAADFGMGTYWFDVTQAEQSWFEVAELLGLNPTSPTSP
jgi:putative hydrolase of the HAD superfamily